MIQINFTSIGNNYKFVWKYEKNILIRFFTKQKTLYYSYDNNSSYILKCPKGIIYIDVLIDSIDETDFLNIFLNTIKIYYKKNTNLIKHNNNQEHINIYNYFGSIKIPDFAYINNDQDKCLLQINNYSKEIDQSDENNTTLNIINEYNKFIEQQFIDKNVLIVGTDSVGHGGAGTGTMNLYNRYKNICSQLFVLYIDKNNFENDNIITCDENHIDETLTKIKTKMKMKIDCIIFRNWCYIEPFRKIETYKYFMIAGIFKSELEKNCDSLTNEEIMKNINWKVIEMIDFCNESYSNSYLSQQLLKKYLNIRTKIYYFNYFNIKYNITSKKRKYKYGYICSEMNRKIKNTKFVCNFYKEKKDEKKIVIGDNSNEYFKDIENTDIIDFCDHTETLEIMNDIENIIVPSYYDSCSNVINEGINAGCKIYCSEMCGNVDLANIFRIKKK